jgi:hypothetical protein
MPRTPHQIFIIRVTKIKKIEMGKVCTYGGDEEYVQSFGGET